VSKEKEREHTVSCSQLAKEDEMKEKTEASKRLSRKEFVKGAAVGAVGAAAVGGLASCAPAATPVPTTAPEPTATTAPATSPTSVPEETYKYETDVLVVGLGFAGLCAAARALEQGASVIVMDKQAEGFWTPGGSMVVAGGSVHWGISLGAPPDEIAARLKEKTADMIRPEMLAACADNSNRAIEWYVEKGAKFEEAGPLYYQQSPPTPPPVWGRLKPGGVQDATNGGNKQNALKVYEFITDNGGEVLYETKALELLTNAEGEVIGVRCEGQDGRFNIGAKAVVLASGGYSRNHDMMLKYIGPKGDEIVKYANPGCTGDGIAMAEKLGAYLRSMNYAAFSHFYSVDCYWKPDLVGAYLDVPSGQGIIVDGDGHRYFNESLGRRIGGSLVTKNSIYIRRWLIIDEAIYQMENVKAKVDDVAEFGGTIYKADTIEELAQEAGIGPLLAVTVAEFNKAVDEGTTAELDVPRTTNANKISTAPFYAFEFVPGIVATYGGLLVSPEAEVLDRDEKPIPGLYAAGEIMQGSLSGGIENSDGAYAGMLASCLVFGLIAAESAALRAKA
jgi:succinate dehydrogenase/fumarate reductase flavoprotein subunit